MATYKSYIVGFILSVALTLVAYSAVVNRTQGAVFIIFAVAILELFVQLIFFLHMGRGQETRWNWVLLLFAMMVIGILVGGSLWIMNNLNYNMTPSQMNASMLDQAE